MLYRSELEIYLAAAAAMARRGIIVAACGMSQADNGSIAVSRFGAMPNELARHRKNVTVYAPLSVRREMSRRWMGLARKARSGKIIGVACVLVFDDGAAEHIAIGSLSGMRAILGVFAFRPPHGPDRRRHHDRRRRHPG